MVKLRLMVSNFIKIGGNLYILTSTAKISDPNAKLPINDTDHKSNSTDTNNNSISDTPGKADKPTQKEIDYLLKEKGYVYFSNSELAQIKKSLWEKIQNYRVQQGYEPYKSNPELDSFINKVSSNADNMFLYSEDINNQDIAKYLPTLAGKGMNAVQAVDHYKYYGKYLGAPANFNLYDRNPEHVATEIFNSLKNDPFYESKIVGLFDKKAFGSLGLNYYWDGTDSRVGLVFVEVAGTSKG